MPIIEAVNHTRCFMNYLGRPWLREAGGAMKPEHARSVSFPLVRHSSEMRPSLGGRHIILVLGLALVVVSSLKGAGPLTSKGGADKPMQVKGHHHRRDAGFQPARLR